MENVRVSMRYAKALYPIADAEGKSEEVLSDLSKIVNLINTSADLRLLIHSPIITSLKKKRIFEEIFKDKISTITYNFLILLVGKGRENMIKGIFYCFNNLYNQANNLIACKIISAREMDSDARHRVVEFIEHHTKLRAVPEYLLDSNLLGGMKIKIDGWVYDATLQNKLKNLKRVLVK